MVNQDDFIEQLSETVSLRGFLALACQKLTQQVNSLVERVFRKQDFALKSVVDSLFEHQGPLADLSVRLKLLLSLGVISAELYQDINAFLEFKLWLSDEVEELSFADNKVIGLAKSLHMADLTAIDELLKHSLPCQPESMQYQMQQHRLATMLRSCLILTLTEMLEQLDVESPL